MPFFFDFWLSLCLVLRLIQMNGETSAAPIIDFPLRMSHSYQLVPDRRAAINHTQHPSYGRVHPTRGINVRSDLGFVQGGQGGRTIGYPVHANESVEQTSPRTIYADHPHSPRVGPPKNDHEQFSFSRAQTPRPNRARVTKLPKQRKTRGGKAEKVKVPKITEPLSVLTKDYDHIPVRDMEAWVNRSAEDRQEEAKKRKGYITRPMNSFMLYRSAYTERTKQWCTQNNHQVVSAVSGESWPMEPAEIRDKYNELAKIERANHQKAHPEYKFSPSKNAQPQKKRRGEFSAEDGEEDDDKDPEWRPVHHRRPAPTNAQQQHVRLMRNTPPQSITPSPSIEWNGIPIAYADPAFTHPYWTGFELHPDQMNQLPRGMFYDMTDHGIRSIDQAQQMQQIQRSQQVQQAHNVHQNQQDTPLFSMPGPGLSHVDHGNNTNMRVRSELDPELVTNDGNDKMHFVQPSALYNPGAIEQVRMDSVCNSSDRGPSISTHGYQAITANQMPYRTPQDDYAIEDDQIITQEINREFNEAFYQSQ